MGHPPDEALRLARQQWDQATRPPPSRVVPYPGRAGFEAVNPFSVHLP